MVKVTVGTTAAEHNRLNPLQPSCRNESTLKIRSPLLRRCAAHGFTGLIRLLFHTLQFDLRCDVRGINPYESCGDRRFLYCVWHDSMLIPTFAGRHRCAAALISRHIDWMFVCDVLRTVGMSVVRGSTNHGGASAIRKLITISKDQHIVITPDGPRGPRRRMSIGIVFLASQTGRAIVPTAYSCTDSWTVRGSWTNLVIPKPFTKVFLLAGEPIIVPKTLGRDDCLPYMATVRGEMDRLSAITIGLAGNAEGQNRGATE